MIAAEQQAKHAKQQVEQERQRAMQAEQQVEELRQRLRDLGLDPDQL